MVSASRGSINDRGSGDHGGVRVGTVVAIWLKW